MNFSFPFAACLASLVMVVSAAAEPVISEFMASNDATLPDGDGVFSDWIEIHNPDPDDADLAGWALRDEDNTWFFPDFLAWYINWSACAKSVSRLRSSNVETCSTPTLADTGKSGQVY